MTDLWFVLLIISALRLTWPLLLAALGGYFSEKSGVAQIALEGFMLTGAFTAASVAFATQSLAFSYGLAFLSAALMAQFFCLFVLYFKVNSIITGTALNLLVMGLIPITSKLFFNSTGSTPSHELSAPAATWSIIIGLVTIVLAVIISEKSIWGLRIKFAGEKKEALESIGVSAEKIKWQAVTLGAGLAGLGGAFLSLSMASNYSPLMSAGRGFMALAAVIFGGWRISMVIAACFLFGFIEALQIQAQSIEWVQQNVPSIYFQLTPYILTLIALAIVGGRSKAPKQLS